MELRGMGRITITLDLIEKDKLGELLTKLERQENIIVRVIRHQDLLSLLSRDGDAVAKAMKTIQPYYKKGMTT